MPAKKDSKFQIFMSSVCLIVLITILYLSWIPDSAFVHLTLMPSWIAEWSDNFPRLRTMIPFFTLSLLLALAFPKKKYIVLVQCFVVIFSESMQLLIPTRFFDFFDIAYGLLGVFLGYIIVFWGEKYLQVKKRKF